MVQLWTLPSALMLLAPQVQGGSGGFNPIESIFNPSTTNVNHETNATMVPPMQRGPTPSQREAERHARSERNRERKRRMKEAMKKVKLDPEHVQRVSKKEIEAMGEDHPLLRGLSWGSHSSSNNAIQYADPGNDWAMWQQAYRMLGGFIDCDHNADGDDGSGDDGDDDQEGCSRWMMWAAYIDPNYQSGGYDEYFGDDATGLLDCHNPDTEWQLLGVYRQEFYQFIEQISKHVWAIDEYEYVVALAGLSYMTDADCWAVGYASDGTTVVYAGIEPLAYGKYQISLYTDDGKCLTPNADLGMTFDDFGLTSDMQLSSQDDGDGDDGDGDSETYWQAAQEYTLADLNDVYETFKYCTSCIDYPTYQDGYVIGDDGTDDDDLINQCWKFYSHDSFACEADCIAMGHAQGTIVSVDAGGQVFGSILSEYYQDSAARSEAAQAAVEANAPEETALSRLFANAFVTLSFIVFVATFLAFAVARRSRYRESRNSKSRRLLADDEDGRSRSRKSVRSKSRTREKDEEGDGLFRSSTGRKSRSKSKNGRSKSNGRSRSRGKSETEHEVPKSQSRSRSKRSGSKSRRQVDDF